MRRVVGRGLKHKILLLGTCAALMFLIGGVTFAQFGAGYRIRVSSIDNGALFYPNLPANAPYALRGTIGQSEGGVTALSGGGFTLQGGITLLPVQVVLPPSGAVVAPISNYYLDPNVPLSWERVSYAVGYWLQVAWDKNFTHLVFDKNDLSAAQLSQIVLLPGNGTYYWRVSAKMSAATWGKWSAIGQFVVGTEPSFATSTSSIVCPSLGFVCSQLFTCQEAYACLAAGNFSLDPDNDGIPCEDAPLMCS